MHTYLLSDLHLSTQRPDLIAAFTHFLNTEARTAERIYLLGDLFEYWIGDDAATEVGAQPVLAAMHQLSSSVDCYFIAGNRDFLVGQQFTQQTGFKVLPDESVVNLYGTSTLLLHGDSMCTDDTAHMQFRKEVVTNTARKEQFLSLPIPMRIEQAQAARTESNQHKTSVSMSIMDVTTATVVNTFRQYNVQQMIHGHTHRQGQHSHQVDGRECIRYVLGDWEQTSSIMTVSKQSIVINNHAIS